MNQRTRAKIRRFAARLRLMATARTLDQELPASIRKWHAATKPKQYRFMAGDRELHVGSDLLVHRATIKRFTEAYGDRIIHRSVRAFVNIRDLPRWPT